MRTSSIHASILSQPLRPTGPLRRFTTVIAALSLGLSLQVSMRAQSDTTAGKRPVAPEWQLKDLSGKTVKLSDFKGKIVVLDFWAT